MFMLRYGVLAAVVWVVGLVTAVPLALYYLLFHAPREQYALLIVFIIGWPFGYWGIVGPILMLLKLRSVYRSLQQVRSVDELRRQLSDGQTEDVLIGCIAHEWHIPKFLARRACRWAVRRMAASGRLEPTTADRNPAGRALATATLVPHGAEVAEAGDPPDTGCGEQPTEE